MKQPNPAEFDLATAPFVIAQSLSDLNNAEEAARITASFHHAAIVAGVTGHIVIQKKDCVALITKDYDDFQRVESIIPPENVCMIL